MRVYARVVCCLRMLFLPPPPRRWLPRRCRRRRDIRSRRLRRQTVCRRCRAAAARRMPDSCRRPPRRRQPLPSRLRVAFAAPCTQHAADAFDAAAAAAAAVAAAVDAPRRRLCAWRRLPPPLTLRRAHSATPAARLPLSDRGVLLIFTMLFAPCQRRFCRFLLTRHAPPFCR